MLVNDVILNFHNFIVLAWSSIDRLMDDLDWDNDPYFIDYWLQANWELMVEKHVVEEGSFLHGYGTNDPMFRYTSIRKQATHRIMVRKNGESNKYCFLDFVSKNNNVIEIKTPFEYISVKLIGSNKITYLELHEVVFSLEKVKPNLSLSSLQTQ